MDKRQHDVLVFLTQALVHRKKPGDEVDILLFDDAGHFSHFLSALSIASLPLCVKIRAGREVIVMGFKTGLNCDHDICPILSAAVADPKAKENELVPCRIDCAWYDDVEHKCAWMSINVSLKGMEPILNPPKHHSSVG